MYRTICLGCQARVGSRPPRRRHQQYDLAGRQTDASLHVSHWRSACILASPRREISDHREFFGFGWDFRARLPHPSLADLRQMRKSPAFGVPFRRKEQFPEGTKCRLSGRTTKLLPSRIQKPRACSERLCFVGGQTGLSSPPVVGKSERYMRNSLGCCREQHSAATSYRVQISGAPRVFELVQAIALKTHRLNVQRKDWADENNGTYQVIEGPEFLTGSRDRWPSQTARTAKSKLLDNTNMEGSADSDGAEGVGGLELLYPRLYCGGQSGRVVIST